MGLLSGALLLCLVASPARAICNVIPAATQDFRGALGSLNRPFASPGDVVELRVRPGVCDRTSTGFVDTDGDGAENDHVVLVLFVPPAGTANATVLAEDCAGVDLAGCNAQLGGGSATCVPVNGLGQPPGLAVSGANELQFRFPDTDAQLAPDGDDRTYAGPVKVVVSRAGAPLRCDLAGTRCADLGGDTSTHGVVACVDELFALDGTCRVTPADVDAVFGHATALPPPNDFVALVSQPATTELRFTTDAAGHALVPMDYTGVLLRLNGVPIALLARAGTNVEAFSGGGQAVSLPGDGFVASYSPEGVRLPPVFAPLSDPSDPGQTTLFGSVDAPRGVIRVAERGCESLPGVPAADEGKACTSGAGCSSGVCSPLLFDFQDRFVSGVGPVVLVGASGQYVAVTEMPVPLEGLVEGEETFAFVLSEALDGVDRNGDGDVLDAVATLRDRETGLLQAIGTGGSEGRGAARVRRPPFSFPALATRGKLLAFHESEPAQSQTDLNANGQVFETVLRVFELGATSATELTDPADPPTSDPDLRLNGRSVVISNGLVFFRTPEAAEAAVTTLRVSVDSAGNEADAYSQTPSLSTDGRFVAFNSGATNLVTGDTNGAPDVFVRDRDTDADGVYDEPGAVATVRVSIDSAGAEGNGVSQALQLSPDGAFVAIGSQATNLIATDTNGILRDVFVHDRDTDADDVYDEAGAISTGVVSVDSAGSQSSLARSPFTEFYSVGVSAGGRFLVFDSAASDLVAGDTNGFADAFLHDRDSDEDGVYDEPGAIATTRMSVDSLGAEGNGPSFFPAVSADGRFLIFRSTSTNLDGPEPGVFVHARQSGETRRASVDSTGAAASSTGSFAAISVDGRFVVFDSPDASLVPGDTNGFDDVYLHDRDADADGVFDEPGAIATVRVSVSSEGVQADAAVSTGSNAVVSADGRFVAYQTSATTLAPGPDTNGADDVFLHDRLTGSTARVSVDTAGSGGSGASGGAAVSGDGRFVAFYSDSDDLVTGDGNLALDVFVRGPNASDTAADRTGDGALDDTVLRVLDTTGGAPGMVTDLCPAQAVAVAAGKAAFLRPEAAGATSNAECTGPDLGGPDLNGDGDALDAVVHLWDGTGVSNLRCAASEVVLSATRLAALVSEADEAGADLNADADAADRVLHVRAVGAAAPASCGGASWLNTGEAADALGLSGDVVALITPEAAQGGTDLNGDGDALDRVIRLVDGTTGLLIPIVDDQLAPDVPQAAEEFVLGAGLVAFRTSEAAQGATDLNGDGDQLDDVLQVYDLVSGERINTGQAVVPCRLVACDPRRPYRVSQATVRFLTLESDQGADLNDDGDQDDLLVQVYNAASRQARVVAEVADTGATLESPDAGGDPLGAPAPADADSGGEQVVVTQGRCVDDTGVACTPGSCAAGEFCLAELGTCVRDTGLTCLPDKPVGQQGCLVGATCTSDFAVLGVADADADEVPDALDNCPVAANVGQADADGDGVGDACDLQTCGNLALELDEECDDGDLVDGDGCDSNCRATACGNGIVTAGEACDDGNLLLGDGCGPTCLVEGCNDGFDNDGDGLVDVGSDPGCASAGDVSERSLALACDDGVDNDGDGRVDFDPATEASPGDPNTPPAGSGDPGCRSPTWLKEDPQCQDGLNNDPGAMDGTDYDGGFAAGGPPGGTPDPQCVAPWKNCERLNCRCGLGLELTLLLPVLMALRARRRC